MDIGDEIFTCDFCGKTLPTVPDFKNGEKHPTDHYAIHVTGMEEATAYLFCGEKCKSRWLKGHCHEL